MYIVWVGVESEENQLIRNLLSYHEPMHTRDMKSDNREVCGV